MAHTFTNLAYHAIFGTKDRQPLIRGVYRDRVYAYIGGILNLHEGLLIRAGGTSNHVHLLFQSSATTATAEIMRVVKTNSSKWIHETYPDADTFFWQTGYAAFTASKSAIPDVARYIENQEKHHRTQTFEDEYKALLCRHEIEFDKRFVFE